MSVIKTKPTSHIILITVSILLFAFSSSCIISKTSYGDYESQKGLPQVDAKGKEIYLFWDKVELQKMEEVQDYENYEKVIKRNFFDAVVFYGTAGILSIYTVKIKTKPTANGITE